MTDHQHYFFVCHSAFSDFLGYREQLNNRLDQRYRIYELIIIFFLSIEYDRKKIFPLCKINLIKIIEIEY